MGQQRVVITGLGTVNALAVNVSDFMKALKEGVCGIGPVTVFDTAGFRTHTGGEARGFSAKDLIPPEFRDRRMSRSDGMAMAAALEALKDAGLFPFPEEIAADAGVVIGGGAGGMLECEAVYRDYLAGGNKSTRLSQFASFCCAASADYITAKLGLMGPKTTFMTACSSGGTALGYARDLIQSGAAEIVIAGGVEPLSRVTYGAFNALQAVDPDYPRPFDKNRQGMSLGEGAGMLILESLSRAQHRGARIYAELLGYGVSCDAHHMTAPDPSASGAIRCMAAALKDAGVSPDRVSYINAHGTGTPANDVMETRGIKAVFGRRAYDIPVSSTKSMHGHTLGAAGAIEGLVCALAVAHGFIPPTIHHQEPDPECDLDYVAGGYREQPVFTALSNSFAFGGNNTSVVLGRYTEKGVRNE
ncbi:MAG: beta-ketoacyl-[acyl-carrier-protein] synthase family protein [Thermodesulfobacteriota bacterium]